MDNKVHDNAKPCTTQETLNILFTYKIGRLTGCIRHHSYPTLPSLLAVCKLRVYEITPITLLLAYERIKAYIGRKIAP